VQNIFIYLNRQAGLRRIEVTTRTFSTGYPQIVDRFPTWECRAISPSDIDLIPGLAEIQASAIKVYNH